MHSEIGTFFATDPRAATFLPATRDRTGRPDLHRPHAAREQTYAPNFTFNAGAQYRSTWAMATR